LTKTINQQTFSIGNEYHVTLRICPEIYKQCLQLTCWRVKASAEKTNTLETKIKKSKHKLWQLKLENTPFSK